MARGAVAPASLRLSETSGDSAGRIQQYLAAWPGSREDSEPGATLKLHAGNDQSVVAHVMARIRTQSRKQLEQVRGIQAVCHDSN